MDIKALSLIFIKSTINLCFVLIMESILIKIYNNTHGNDFILAHYATVLILCTCELKCTFIHLLI